MLSKEGIYHVAINPGTRDINAPEVLLMSLWWGSSFKSYFSKLYLEGYKSFEK